MKKVFIATIVLAVMLGANNAWAQRVIWVCNEGVCRGIRLKEPSYYKVANRVGVLLTPSENVKIELHEKWDKEKGERTFRQKPDLRAKEIDAATEAKRIDAALEAERINAMTTLGTVLILGVTLGLIAR